MGGVAGAPGQLLGNAEGGANKIGVNTSKQQGKQGGGGVGDAVGGAGGLVGGLLGGVTKVRPLQIQEKQLCF